MGALYWKEEFPDLSIALLAPNMLASPELRGWAPISIRVLIQSGIEEEEVEELSPAAGRHKLLLVILWKTK